jgi:methylmalonyl-CoA mutase C-terminal domain/subunit
MPKTRLRVLIGKPGLDGHDRGAKIIARALRDAGMEVVYTGLHRSPEEIVETAIQEDVDAIGLSILSGAHMTLFPKVIQLLKEQNAQDILVFGGGIIPEEDREQLLKAGVAEVFIPGGATQRTIEFLRAHFEKKYKSTPEKLTNKATLPGI